MLFRSSCASEAVETAKLSLKNYDMVDLLLGLERHDGHSTEFYKAIDTPLQHALQGYTQQGGRLMVSGAYVGCDMTTESEQTVLANVLRCRYAGRSMAQTNEVKGLGTTLYYYKNLNEEHYAAPSTDILQPTSGAFTAMLYDDGFGAAVAFKEGGNAVFVMGFPFECIKEEQKRSSIMKGIINYLINN